MAHGISALAIANLAAEVLTPIAVVGLGILIARASRRVEAVQQSNKAITGRRLEIFDLVAPKLNQLLCFATFVGRWKDITPDDALSLKREIDEALYSNRLVFSDRFFDAYRNLMKCLFAMYATVDADALIRAPIRTQWGDRANLEWWNRDFATLFAPETNQSTEADLVNSFDRLTAAWRADLYVSDSGQALMATLGA